MVEPLNMVFLFTVLFILKFTLTVGIEKNYETMPFMFSDAKVSFFVPTIIFSFFLPWAKTFSLITKMRKLYLIQGLNQSLQDLWSHAQKFYLPSKAEATLQKDHGKIIERAKWKKNNLAFVRFAHALIKYRQCNYAVFMLNMSVHWIVP